jgi:hypothetical protein
MVAWMPSHSSVAETERKNTVITTPLDRVNAGSILEFHLRPSSRVHTVIDERLGSSGARPRIDQGRFFTQRRIATDKPESRGFPAFAGFEICPDATGELDPSPRIRRRMRSTDPPRPSPRSPPSLSPSPAHENYY